MTVAWFTSEDLGVMVRRHRPDDSVTRALARLIRTDLIIVDDIGLLPVLADADAAEGFYRLIDAAYERRALAVSSNLHPSGFDEIMPKTLATATVDRLLPSRLRRDHHMAVGQRADGEPGLERQHHGERIRGHRSQRELQRLAGRRRRHRVRLPRRLAGHQRLTHPDLHRRLTTTLSAAGATATAAESTAEAADAHRRSIVGPASAVVGSDSWDMVWASVLRAAMAA
jgi:hypothetical protein